MPLSLTAAAPTFGGRTVGPALGEGATGLPAVLMSSFHVLLGMDEEMAGKQTMWVKHGKIIGKTHGSYI